MVFEKRRTKWCHTSLSCFLPMDNALVMPPLLNELMKDS